METLWKSIGTGSYFSNGSWYTLAPGAGDTADINGTFGATPLRLSGIFVVNGADDVVDLYQAGTVPSLLPDPPAASIPVAPVIANETINSAGGSALVEFVLVNSTLGSGSVLNVTGNALFDANYGNTLAGNVYVEPVAGGPVNNAGFNGELDILVEPIGSVDPRSASYTGYVPTVTNTGLVLVGDGSDVTVGFNGAPPQINNLNGVLSAVGGVDQFVNNGSIGVFGGTFSVRAGYQAFGSSYNTFVNNGLVAILGDTAAASASFDAAVSGTGSLIIAGKGAAQASATFQGGTANAVTLSDGTANFQTNNSLVTNSYTGSFTFSDNAGALVLTANAVATGFMPITGFSAGDTIEVDSVFLFTPDQFEHNLVATPTVTWNQAAGTLTVGYTNLDGAFSGTIGVLSLKGTYTQSQFSAVASGGSGSIGSPGYVLPHATISVTACYAPGTAILAETGEVPVECLAIGDLVRTAGGALRPVRWIGRRSYARRFALGNRRVWPVVFRAGALGTDALGRAVPHRDLAVSPEHAMLIDGMLIPARALLNGDTVVQERPADRVDYVHVELDTHDALLAEGCASESYVDDGNRALFDNAASFHALYPGTIAGPAAYCAPRVDSGPGLEAVRARLTPARACLMAA